MQNMKAPAMRLMAPEISRVTHEEVILDELLHLDGAKVLELGCGSAHQTRWVAQKAASVLALEVDHAQHALNLQIGDLPNVTFGIGAAEAIPATDASFDIVLMFKSLHHVPLDQLDRVFDELRRVLKKNGLAYISEPVFDGALNEIMRVFNDEQQVREAAFAAEQRAAADGKLQLVGQTFFLQPVHIDGFDSFEQKFIKVTHSDRRLTPEQHDIVRARFEQHMTPGGADFLAPMRVDLFKK